MWPRCCTILSDTVFFFHLILLYNYSFLCHQEQCSASCPLHLPSNWLQVNNWIVILFWKTYKCEILAKILPFFAIGRAQKYIYSLSCAAATELCFCILDWWVYLWLHGNGFNVRNQTGAPPPPSTNKTNFKARLLTNNKGEEGCFVNPPRVCQLLYWSTCWQMSLIILYLKH